MDETNKTVFVNTEIEHNETPEQEDIDKLYRELGKAYYEGAFEDPLPQLLPLFDKLTAAMKKQRGEADMLLQNLNNNPIPSPRTCRGCGAEIPGNARFCAVCGMPLDETGGLPAGPKTCSNCGSLLEEDAVFCGNCGMRL